MNQWARGAFDATNASVWQLAGYLAPSMIIPLTGSGDKFTAEAVAQGHHVLIVAQQSNPDEVPQQGELTSIDLSVYNSLEKDTKKHRDIYHQVAQEIVQNSGWLMCDAEGSPEFHGVKVSSNVTVASPKQGDELASCGYYVILNAWAVLLGLKVIPRKQPLRLVEDKSVKESDFLLDARALVDAAITGKLDFRVIEAFFHYWKYVKVGESRVPVCVTEEIDPNNRWQLQLIAEGAYDRSGQGDNQEAVEGEEVEEADEEEKSEDEDDETHNSKMSPEL